MDLKSIVTLYEQGQGPQAMAALETYLQQNPNDEAGWEFKMTYATLPFEKQAAMERLLMLNPQHPTALIYQKQLGQTAVKSPAGPPSPTKGPVKSPTSRVRADGVREVDEGIYQMLWDCEFCGTTKLLGLTHRYCPHCGGQQNPNKRYYPSDNEKVAVKDHQFTGEDLTCSVCKTLNGGKADFCMNCGAPLTDAAKAQKLGSESRATNALFEGGKARDLVKERFDSEMQRVKGNANTDKKGGFSITWIGVAVAACLVLCVGAVLAALFWDRTEGVEVTGHQWERVIEIQSFQTLSDGDWCDSMPGDAFSVSRSERQRSTRQVPDGETCRTVRVDNGDGSYSQRQECTPKYRDEPVYDDYCQFSINRWSFERDVKTDGNNLSDTPNWPSFSLNSQGERLGSEREGERKEVYTVTFRNSDGDTYKCEFNNESRWRSFPIESRWTLSINVVTGNPDCDDIKSQ